MKKRSKRYKKLKKQLAGAKNEIIESLLPIIKDNSTTKFDESIDISIKLNLKKEKENNIRTLVNFPHGLGKKVVVAVLCEENKINDAKESKADLYGSDDLLNKISAGEIKFNKLVSTPAMMSKIGKLGKILGPKGLMPNPKLGTVTNDIKSVVKALKTGQTEIKSDKDGNLSCSIGKKSFPDKNLIDNFNILLDTIIKEKSQSIKGNFIKSTYLTSTMGTSYKMKTKNI